MAMPSSGTISIGNIVREILTNDGSLGTTTPNSTQVNIGLSSLTETSLLPHNQGNLPQYGYIATGWYKPNMNSAQPHSMSEWYGADREGV
jgi:hypothetical protein